MAQDPKAEHISIGDKPIPVAKVAQLEQQLRQKRAEYERAKTASELESARHMAKEINDLELSLATNRLNKEWRELKIILAAANKAELEKDNATLLKLIGVLHKKYVSILHTTNIATDSTWQNTSVVLLGCENRILYAHAYVRRKLQNIGNTAKIQPLPQAPKRPKKPHSVSSTPRIVKSPTPKIPSAPPKSKPAKLVIPKRETTSVPRKSANLKSTVPKFKSTQRKSASVKSTALKFKQAPRKSTSLKSTALRTYSAPKKAVPKEILPSRSAASSPLPTTSVSSVISPSAMPTPPSKHKEKTPKKSDRDDVTKFHIVSTSRQIKPRKKLHKHKPIATLPHAKRNDEKEVQPRQVVNLHLTPPGHLSKKPSKKQHASEEYTGPTTFHSAPHKLKQAPEKIVETPWPASAFKNNIDPDQASSESDEDRPTNFWIIKSSDSDEEHSPILPITSKARNIDILRTSPDISPFSTDVPSLLSLHQQNFYDLDNDSDTDTKKDRHIVSDDDTNPGDKKEHPSVDIFNSPSLSSSSTPEEELEESDPFLLELLSKTVSDEPTTIDFDQLFEKEQRELKEKKQEVDDKPIDATYETQEIDQYSTEEEESAQEEEQDQEDDEYNSSQKLQELKNFLKKMQHDYMLAEALLDSVIPGSQEVITRMQPLLELIKTPALLELEAEFNRNLQVLKKLQEKESDSFSNIKDEDEQNELALATKLEKLLNALKAEREKILQLNEKYSISNQDLVEDKDSSPIKKYDKGLSNSIKRVAFVENILKNVDEVFSETDFNQFLELHRSTIKTVRTQIKGNSGNLEHQALLRKARTLEENLQAIEKRFAIFQEEQREKQKQDKLQNRLQTSNKAINSALKTVKSMLATPIENLLSSDSAGEHLSKLDDLINQAKIEHKSILSNTSESIKKLKELADLKSTLENSEKSLQRLFEKMTGSLASSSKNSIDAAVNHTNESTSFYYAPKELDVLQKKYNEFQIQHNELNKKLAAAEQLLRCASKNTVVTSYLEEINGFKENLNIAQSQLEHRLAAFRKRMQPQEISPKFSSPKFTISLRPKISVEPLTKVDKKYSGQDFYSITTDPKEKIVHGTSLADQLKRKKVARFISPTDDVENAELVSLADELGSVDRNEEDDEPVTPTTTQTYALFLQDDISDVLVVPESKEEFSEKESIPVDFGSLITAPHLLTSTEDNEDIYGEPKKNLDSTASQEEYAESLSTTLIPQHDSDTLPLTSTLTIELVANSTIPEEEYTEKSDHKDPAISLTSASCLPSPSLQNGVDLPEKESDQDAEPKLPPVERDSLDTSDADFSHHSSEAFPKQELKAVGIFVPTDLSFSVTQNHIDFSSQPISEQENSDIHDEKDGGTGDISKKITQKNENKEEQEKNVSADNHEFTPDLSAPASLITEPLVITQIPENSDQNTEDDTVDKDSLSAANTGSSTHFSSLLKQEIVIPVPIDPSFSITRNNINPFTLSVSKEDTLASGQATNPKLVAQSLKEESSEIHTDLHADTSSLDKASNENSDSVITQTQQAGLDISVSLSIPSLPIVQNHVVSLQPDSEQKMHGGTDEDKEKTLKETAKKELEVAINSDLLDEDTDTDVDDPKKREEKDSVISSTSKNFPVSYIASDSVSDAPENNENLGSLLSFTFLSPAVKREPSQNILKLTAGVDIYDDFDSFDSSLFSALKGEGDGDKTVLPSLLRDIEKETLFPLKEEEQENEKSEEEAIGSSWLDDDPIPDSSNNDATPVSTKEHAPMPILASQNEMNDRSSQKKDAKKEHHEEQEENVLKIVVQATTKEHLGGKPDPVFNPTDFPKRPFDVDPKFFTTLPPLPIQLPHVEISVSQNDKDGKNTIFPAPKIIEIKEQQKSEIKYDHISTGDANATHVPNLNSPQNKDRAEDPCTDQKNSEPLSDTLVVSSTNGLKILPKRTFTQHKEKYGLVRENKDSLDLSLKSAALSNTELRKKTKYPSSRHSAKPDSATRISFLSNFDDFDDTETYEPSDKTTDESTLGLNDLLHPQRTIKQRAHRKRQMQSKYFDVNNDNTYNQENRDSDSDDDSHILPKNIVDDSDQKISTDENIARELHKPVKNTWLSRLNSRLNFLWMHIIRRFDAVFVAGFFLMLGFAVFASSMNFGLAMPKGFLMQGILGTPLVVFALAALSAGFIAHLVMRALKFSVADTPTSQAIASVLEAQKILAAWRKYTKDNKKSSKKSSLAILASARKHEDKSDTEFPLEMQMRFISDLSQHIKKIRPLFTEPWSKALIVHDDSILKNLKLYTDIFDDIENRISLDGTLIKENRDLLTTTLSFITRHVQIDPNYRPDDATSIKISRFKISASSIIKICKSAISAAFLIGCIVMLSYIFTIGATLQSLGAMDGMTWSMILAAILGMASWFSTKHVLHEISGGPYATLAAIIGVGLLTFVTLLGFHLSGVMVGLSLPVLVSVTTSSALLFGAFVTFAYYKNIHLTPKQRTEKSTPFKKLPYKNLLVAGLLTSLSACVVPLFFILAGTLNSWSLLLVIPAGFACLGLTDYTANRISNSPFANLAALSLLGCITVTLVGLLMLGSGAGMPMALIVASIVSFTTFSMSAFLVSRDKKSTTQRVGQDGERLLQMLKVVLIVGLLLLAFLSMTLIFQLYKLGQLNSNLGFAFDIIAEKLGYGGFETGAQWMSAFFVGIFATSGFAAFELLKSILQISPINTEELEKHKNLITTAVMLLKLTFTIGIITLLTAMPSVFAVSGAVTSMLPVFLVLIGVMPLFSGNARLPFKSFNHIWNNQLFKILGLGIGLGVTPLFNKTTSRLWFRYIFREFAVVAILSTISLGPYFAAGKGQIPFVVLAIGVMVTMLFRWTTMWRNVHNATMDQYHTAYSNSPAVTAEQEDTLVSLQTKFELLKQAKYGIHDRAELFTDSALGNEQYDDTGTSKIDSLSPQDIPLQYLDDDSEEEQPISHASQRNNAPSILSTKEKVFYGHSFSRQRSLATPTKLDSGDDLDYQPPSSNTSSSLNAGSDLPIAL